MRTRIVDTCLGPVEVALTPSRGEVVLFFPGGHTTAATPLYADLYTGLGYRALVFSRPGYGLTNVGPLTAAEFIPAIARVCERLGITAAAATVGLSFGGLQAAQVRSACRTSPRGSSCTAARLHPCLTLTASCNASLARWCSGRARNG